jgi:hypothetical protein
MGTMIQGFLRSWSTYLGALALFSSAACTVAAPQRAPLNTTPDDQSAATDPTQSTDPLDPVNNNGNGAFGKGTSSGSTGSSGGTIAKKTYCDGGLAVGDLNITEMMISSITGSGDSGEWVEITSTRDCWLALKGVSVSSPRGTGSDTATFDVAYDLAPGATFIVADTADSTKNNGLPGHVLSWNSTDVLKNGGDTISVKLGDTVIDIVTYPDLTTVTPGTSLAFPVNCAGAERTDWVEWKPSTATYGTDFHGTPNASNTDIACE